MDLDKYIYNLPDDIQKYIYYDFFHNKIIAEKLCNKLLKEIKFSQSIRLDYLYIRPTIEKVINNKLAVDILCKNDNLFKNLYNTIIVKENKIFKLMDSINDLSLSWLMYLYH